ncbi:MAG: biotin--[acetyl-CoA-carboxylase] ligase [Caldimonas sp.]
MTHRAGLAIQHVAQTGSTNSDLLARAHAASQAGKAFAACVLVADRQTAGRGRHGRAWHGAEGAALTFSLAWPFAAEVDLDGLSLAVGVALADALDPAPLEPSRPARRMGIKWPNDLWLLDVGRRTAVSEAGSEPDDAALHGRKLAGVLIEAAPCGKGRVAVIGVGLNVAEQAVGDAASGVAWLQEIDASASPASALHALLPALVAALQSFEHGGFDAFAERFAARDVLRGQRLRAGELDGIADGVSASGELWLRTAGGVVPVRSGEVRLQRIGLAAELAC